jgi:hypothetical protein
LDNLKQELELDVHKISMDDLVKRFSSNLEAGLTSEQAKLNKGRASSICFIGIIKRDLET